MPDDPAFLWDRKPSTPPRKPERADSAGGRATRAVEFGDRVTLKEAESRFGVSVRRLRSWARNGAINGVMGSGPTGGRMWLVTPESVARHVSRTVTEKPTPAPTAKTGPTPDGTAMLVPRDAWDRLMDQLGNLHDAGIQLAEARERAARAETEATFLRERLAEMRGERDELKQKVAAPPPTTHSTTRPSQTLVDRLTEAYRKILGR